MNFLIRLAVFLAVFFLVRLAWMWFWRSGWKRLLSYFLGTIDIQPPGSKPAERIATAKRDPVCGTFVDVTVAVEETVDGQVYYFCSEDCRDIFRTRRTQLAGGGPSGKPS